MPFNSVTFLLFVLLFFGFWPLVRKHTKWRLAYIALASLFCYGWWNPLFLPLLLATGLADYLAAIGMERYPSKKRILLYASLALNLGTLILFKYSTWLAGLLGFHLSSNSEGGLVSQIALPVGLSFYTFQSLNYIIEVYRGSIKAERKLSGFFAYLSLFPHLAAGPILRAKTVLPQMAIYKPVSVVEITQGLHLISLGFFRKVVLADNLAPWVNEAFGREPSAASGLFWWIAALSFALQIYYDFSGYSSIALGLLLWMGYQVPANFNHPYWASTLRDFWSRWHISLSTWFRDYVYIPLGGSRVKHPWRADFNMFLTMLLSGLWHGAALKFLAWGAIHAGFLTIERRGARIITIPRILSWPLTMICVIVAWIYFRSPDVVFANKVVVEMFRFGQFWSGMDFIGTPQLYLILIAILPEMWSRIAPTSFTRLPVIRGMQIAFCILASILFRGAGSDFIYFQF